jgi:hypothetical protein
MNKHTLIALAVGVAAGYFLADKLTGYQPFTKAYTTGASL